LFESVTDGKSAVRWVRANAKRLGVDPERVMAGGGSAGGHVAAAAATVPGLDEKREDSSISCKPDALVLFNPVFDNGPPNGYGYERVGERYKEISPIHNIGKGAPPTIVFLGTQDELIPVATGRKYERLMKEAGGRCELHLFEDEGHGFFNRGDNYYKTSMLMDAFLNSLGYVKGEATLERPEGLEKNPNKRTE
jgi:acetyl esterase